MRRKPWWHSRRWKVEALTPSGWQDIYSSAKKSTCRTDARAWTKKTGQKTRVVKDIGHPSLRHKIWES